MAVQPSIAEVLARAESAPITAGLMAEVEALDLAVLSEDQRIAVSVFWHRATGYCEARRALVITAAVAAAPDTKQIPREFAAAGQLGPALGLGTGGMDALIAESGQFANALPATKTLALAGDLPWRKAASIAGNTVGMTPDHIARVEAKVLPKAWGRSPAAHDAAVRRAVEQVDPDRADRERKDRERDIRMATHHYGAGMGELFACMPSEELDLVRAAATAFARRLKAAGDPRTLDQLRVAFLGHCARSYLTHGDPTHCDAVCDPLPSEPPSTSADPDDPDAWREPPDDEDGPSGGSRPLDDPSPTPPAAPSAPTQHGRPVVLHVTWDLTSLLGVTNHCGELRDSGTLLPPTAMRELIVGGGRIRRMVIDPDTGEQLDLTPITWDLPVSDGRAHRQPLVLTITTTARLDDLTDDLRVLVEADPVLREMLNYPLTADELDSTPDDETPSAALAEYTCSRAGHPVNPCAGPTAASAGDIDHNRSRSNGGKTIRSNLGPLVRRWHRIKTFAGWSVRQVTRGWEWTSPTGRNYTVEPHDYRLGP